MDEFVPSEARLGQLLVESPDSDPRLEFSIEVEFEEGEFDGEDGTPFLRISNLTAPGRSWRSIANQSWGGSGASTDRLDAMMLLFRVPNPVKVQSLQLGEVEPGGKIGASLKIVADFESEADRDSLEEVEIEIGSLSLKNKSLDEIVSAGWERNSTSGTKKHTVENRPIFSVFNGAVKKSLNVASSIGLPK